MSIKRFLGIVVSVALLVGIGAGAYYSWRTMNAVSSIPRAKMLPDRTPEPVSSTTPSEQPSTPTSDGKAKNILLLGTDSRDIKLDRGRSDSMMVMHIPKDRKNIYLISIPRDLFVDIPGHNSNKINAAYAFGGPALTVSTVENLLHITIDHVAVVNFKGFIGLVDALGGVTIDNPHTGCDTSNKSNVCWKKGKITMDSDNALRYVRWRHGLPGGDLDRAANQQRVLKAMMSQLISSKTLTNPNTIVSVLEEMGKFVTLDDTFTTNEVVSLGASMRITSGTDIKSFTVPLGPEETRKSYGFIFNQDWTGMAKLSQAFKDDAVGAYAAAILNESGESSSKLAQ